MKTKDLIYLVSCAVNQKKPDRERVAGMDLAALYRQAAWHMLAAAAAPALEEAGVKDERFMKAARSSLLKNATMDAEMEVLFAALGKAGIWHMPLKGIVLQHLYPAYGMRQMSDHDILFDAARADDVRTIMEGLGFTTEHFDVGSHDVYYKKPVCNFEMHRALFGPEHEEKLYEYYKDVEKRLRGDGFEKHLSPEDFYIFMTAHEYKHYAGGGTGLRSLLDTYVYLQKESPDMDYVAAEMEKLGIAAFEAANRSLSQHLFSGGKLTESDREMLRYILTSGAYGTTTHRVENSVRKKGGSKLRYAMSRFFGPMREGDEGYQAYAKQYPFFYEHKLLMPLLPLYRTARGLASGNLISEVKALRKAKKN